MSPILVRPVREQLEHDRVIRLLQAKYKRKFEVAINPGNLQAAPVGTAPAVWYPDLVLQSSERNRKLLGVVEVETVESVNNLEAMSQWAAFSRLRTPFHLYVPQASIDSARRFCVDHDISVAEMWCYAAVGDQMRFSLVQRSAAATVAAAKAAAKAAATVPAKPPVKVHTLAKAAALQPAARPASKITRAKNGAGPDARSRATRVAKGNGKGSAVKSDAVKGNALRSNALRSNTVKLKSAASVRAAAKVVRRKSGSSSRSAKRR